MEAWRQLERDNTIGHITVGYNISVIIINCGLNIGIYKLSVLSTIIRTIAGFIIEISNI